MSDRPDKSSKSGKFGKAGKQGRRGRQDSRQKAGSREADRREKPKGARPFGKPHRSASAKPAGGDRQHVGSRKSDEHGVRKAALSFGKPRRGASARPADGDYRHSESRDADWREKPKGARPFGKPHRGASAKPAESERRHSGSRKPDSGEARKSARPFGKPRRDAAPKRAEDRGRSATGHARPDRPIREQRDERADNRKPEITVAPVATGVQTVTVTPDESGMRIDRFLESKFPGLSFSHIQRMIRKGELRVNGKRREPKDRLEAGQAVRIPPLRLEAPPPRPGSAKDEETKAFLKSITLYEDDDVMVLNKPMGLAVQGGSGMTRHIDGMLGVLTARDGQRPRLVHRLDKDTAGCLLIAKNRFSAAALAKTFRSRSARKIYWALVPSVPKPKQGRISTYLAKEEREDDSIMRVAKHGEKGASHAITYYAVVETAAQKLAWLSLKPVTGRTHQLRVQLAHIEHPIVGDPKYFNIENWELPGGIQNRLHLLARRIAVPHPRGGTIDITAPLPQHMEQSWNLLGFDGKRYDPIDDAPEE